MKGREMLAELVAQSIVDYEVYLSKLTPEQQAIKRNTFWSKSKIKKVS